MPKLDGTGPTGDGAMTGRGRGNCRTTKVAKVGMGLGLGLGLGLVFRQGFRGGFKRGAPTNENNAK